MTLEPIGLATLLFPPRQVAGLGNLSPLWVGEAASAEARVRLYLKQAPTQEMLSECLCAVIGRALGLPIPPAYLVQDPGGFVDGGLLIGSLDQGMPSLRHQISADPDGLWPALRAWPLLTDAALFDEWTANPDRNQGNVLWDADKGWALIDHARALGAWPAGSDLPAVDATVENHLARVVVALQGDLGLMRARKQIMPLRDTWDGMDTAEVARMIPSHRLAMVQRTEDALLFLASRLPRLPALLARHGSAPELPL